MTTPEPRLPEHLQYPTDPNLLRRNRTISSAARHALEATADVIAECFDDDLQFALSPEVIDESARFACECAELDEDTVPVVARRARRFLARALGHPTKNDDDPAIEGAIEQAYAWPPLAQTILLRHAARTPHHPVRRRN